MRRGNVLKTVNDDFRAAGVWSIVIHGLMFLIAFKLGDISGSKIPPPVVYSVTIEGGKKLGGISQAQKNNKTQIAPPKKVTEAPPPKKVVVPVKETKAVVKKTAEPAKSNVTVADPKAAKKPEVKPNKTVAKPPAKKEPSLADIDKELQKAVQRYQGESTDAGGSGFGAARLGGNGFGGGVTRPPEFFRYMNTLKSYIKSGWRWPDRNANLQVRIQIDIREDGEIVGLRKLISSGNVEFDDSGMRAVQLSNPVPPPPPSVYQYFKTVDITFDPRD